VPLDVVEACTNRDVHERPPQPDVHYIAFCDAASGTGTDSYALCIAHYDSERETVVIDVVREYRPRFVPAHVIAELAQLLQRYRISAVYGDRAFAGFHSDEWLRNAVEYRPCLRTTSENYLAALPRMLAGRVRLLDSARARSQFAALERRPLVGHEHVDHPRTASAHDDVAASIAGAVAQVAQAVAMGEIGWQWTLPIVFNPQTGDTLSLGPSPDPRVPGHYLARHYEPWRPYIGAGGAIQSSPGWQPPGGWTKRRSW
jgi:predicted nucleic acid-binding protein